MNYNRENFYKSTFCIFTSVPSEAIEGLESGFVSRSGSRYFFSEEGVYRFSSHWGRAAKCKWRLITLQSAKEVRAGSIGFARWTDFYPDSEHAKIYGIQLNPDNGTLNYYHVDHPECKSALLRSGKDTMTCIRKIRQLIKSTGNWTDERIAKLLETP